MSKHQEAAHCHKDSLDNHPGILLRIYSIAACMQIRTLRNGLCKTEFFTVGSEVVGAFFWFPKRSGRRKRHQSKRHASTSQSQAFPVRGRFLHPGERNSCHRVVAQRRPATSENLRSHARVAYLATYSQASSALNVPSVDNLTPGARMQAAVSRVHWRRAGPRVTRPTAGQVFFVDVRTPESTDMIKSDNVYYVK